MPNHLDVPVFREFFVDPSTCVKPPYILGLPLQITFLKINDNKLVAQQNCLPSVAVMSHEIHNTSGTPVRYHTKEQH